MRDIEELASIAIDCGLRLHRELGPGLFESVYEAILATQLTKAGLVVERQKILPVEFDGVVLADGFRVDLLVEGQLIIEVKSVERLAPVHSKQLLTYLRLAGQPVGLLVNFGGETFRGGLKRIVNGPSKFVIRRTDIDRQEPSPKERKFSHEGMKKPRKSRRSMTWRRCGKPQRIGMGFARSQHLRAFTPPSCLRVKNLQL